MPYVSVIMPTYQHGKFVKGAIDCVLRQTFGNFELIIIDDGSKDGTYDVLQQYQSLDWRVKVFRNEKNSGCPARVCNDAIRKYAQGEYIAFQFDDDFWFDWCLESLVNASYKGDFIYGETIYINYGPKTLRGTGILGQQAIDEQKILRQNFIGNNAVLIRRKVFLNSGGFNESPLLKRVCDWELWIRLLHQGHKAIKIPEVISISYFGTPSSVSQTFDYDDKAVQEFIQQTYAKPPSLHGTKK